MLNVLSYSDYYPFGSLMPGRNGSSGDYRYGFNGYEKDNEVKNITGGHLDFAGYGYDPRTGKRWNVDPKTSSTPWQSPYTYAANNPIENIDTDGETDTYYILVVDGKTGKSAFQTATFEDNFPNKNHFVIHFKDKDGNIEKVNVSEKTFIKARLTLINKASLFRTKRFGRYSTLDKLEMIIKAFEFNDGTETDENAHVEDLEGSKNGKFGPSEMHKPIEENEDDSQSSSSKNQLKDETEKRTDKTATYYCKFCGPESAGTKEELENNPKHKGSEIVPLNPTPINKENSNE